ncbi:hypothetical protein D3C85_1139090 [compost metagenome]
MIIRNNPAARVSLYRPNGKVKKIRLEQYWTVNALSNDYPACSTTGFDHLLSLVPKEERDDVTIVFYDCEGNVIVDPRVYMEDL